MNQSIFYRNISRIVEIQRSGSEVVKRAGFKLPSLGFAGSSPAPIIPYLNDTARVA